MSARKKSPEDRYVHMHITLPPEIAALARRRSVEAYRSLGQVITDALLLAYGGINADDISAD